MNRKLLVLLPLLSACTSEGPIDVGTRLGAIIGGTTDTGDPAVVALYAHAPGSAQGALCTAEVIAPTVLLTAAHCVMTEELGANAVIDVVTGYNVETSRPANVRVVATHRDPAFDLNNPQNGHDIAVVILDRDLGIAPIPFNRQPLTRAMIGQPVRLVGYGLSDGVRQTGAGLKRQVMSQLNNFDNMLLSLGDRSHNTCSGDSGGPALMVINGVETIIGVTSFGDQTCSSGGYDTRVDRYLGFIEQYVGGTTCTPQCGGRVCGADGCGGTCGVCAGGSACSAAGQCVSTCTPQCDGRACGPDGCGGSCGACGAGEQCSAAFQCVSANPCDLAGGYEAEPNDAESAAGPLCTNLTVQGSLASADDVDWYTFAVPAERTYVVRLAQLTADYRLDVFKILDGRLVWLGAPSNQHDLAEQDFVRHAAKAGTYYARVSSARGGFDAAARYLVGVTY